MRDFHGAARCFAPLAALVCVAPVWAQKISVTPANGTGVYHAGDAPIAWDIKVDGDKADTVTELKYQVKKSGGKVLEEGTIPVSGGSAKLTSKQTEPMAYLVQFQTTDVKDDKGKPITALGGALLDAEKITPVQTRPNDFDAFWAKKLAELRALPANVVATEEPSGKEGVRYVKLTMQNVGGATVYAQMAYPTKSGGKYPALVLLQYAGVYGLNKSAVVNPASNGWLAINVMPHSIPLDQPADYYEQLKNTTLKDYATQGNTDRETSYFLKMICGDVRAADYVTGLPEWDGKTLIATGTSQGGYQSFALAGLHPKVSQMIVNVPAGCDLISRTSDRGQGWPYWLGWTPKPANEAAMVETSRYYDPVNFASRIKVPSMVAFGLIDQTSPPANVSAAFNQIATRQKETVVMPLSEHTEKGAHTQAAYYKRSGEWMATIQKTGKAPVVPPMATTSAK